MSSQLHITLGVMRDVTSIRFKVHRGHANFLPGHAMAAKYPVFPVEVCNHSAYDSIKAFALSSNPWSVSDDDHSERPI